MTDILLKFAFYGMAVGLFISCLIAPIVLLLALLDALTGNRATPTKPKGETDGP